MMGSILLAVVTTALFVFAQWCWFARQRLVHYERYATRFYSHLRPLIEDPETPSSLLRLLAFLNREIVDRGAPRVAMTALRVLERNGREEARAKEKEKAYGESDELLSFFQRRPELARAFSHAASDGLLAISYMAPFSGSRLRKFVLNSNVARSSEASRHFIVKFERSSHGSSCGLLDEQNTASC